MKSTWLAIVGTVAVMAVAFAQYLFVVFLLIEGAGGFWPHLNGILAWVVAAFALAYPFIVLALMFHAVQKAWGVDKREHAQ